MTKMYILPGMGADHRMYSGPWERLPNAIFINWPPYRGEISIEAMAQRVMNEYRIEKQSVIIGSSLGGIVACEIAKHCECQKLILIGSAKNPREIHSFLK
ncbi:MAG: YqiA/YcfP family alpha/beta fold hydrolase, partial [Verrucomicrobiota bacterium]